jgi:hypothetical protein
MKRQPIAYRYATPSGTIVITRRWTGEAYARNGNVGNPTQYFRWEAVLNGKCIGAFFTNRANAYEAARGFRYCDERGKVRGIGGEVRYYLTVRDEMRANYKGRATVAPAAI